MRATYGTVSSRHTRLVLLGAVLMGCVFSLPGHAAAAGITVQILKPDCDPIVFDAGQEYEFEAVAFAQGAELEGGQVTWNWDFGDDTPDSAANPTAHTFAARGNFHVVVTATYGTLSGQAELNVQAASPGTEELREKTTLTAHCGGPSGPAFGGGQVCDETALAVRIPLSAVNGHLDEVRFERLTTAGWSGFAVFGSAQLETEIVDNQASYLCWTDWPTCADKNDVTVSFRARITVGHYDPNNGYVESWYTAAQGWAPKNTVVKAATADPLKHMKGDAKHTLSWDITHLACDPAPTFNAHVQVFDLGGGEVASATVPCGIGTGSWDWVPTCGPMGEDANGLYTYKVTAEHGMCGDCDKAGAPTWQVDGLTAALDVPTMTATFTLQYHATGGDVTEAEAVIYNPDLDELARLTLGAGGEVPANALLTAQAQVQLPPGGPWGAFRVALLGNQTFDAGLANRDRVAKPVVPHGTVAGLCPSAWILQGDTSLSCTATDSILCAMGLADDVWGTRYAPAARVPTAHQAIEAMKEGSVVVIAAHGTPQNQQLGLGDPGQELEHWLWGARPAPGNQVDCPDSDVYYLELQPSSAFQRTLLAVLAGCHTWNQDGDDIYPNGLAATISSKGAANVMGFNKTVYAGPLGVYLTSLFCHTMKEGQTLGGAHALALLEVGDMYDGELYGVDGAHSLHDGQLLKRARWP